MVEDPVVTGKQLVAEEKVMEEEKGHGRGKGAKNCLQGLCVYICICMYVRWSVDMCVCVPNLSLVFFYSFAVIVPSFEASVGPIPLTRSAKHQSRFYNSFLREAPSVNCYTKQ